ncbi:MAG TPA: porin [Verrucomicrobiae bacterium]|nr:porin [Verrucomicrobiae bacterium]
MLPKLAVVAFGVLVLGATSQAQTDAERIQKLEDAVRQLQQEKEELKREVDKLKATPGAATSTASGPGTNWVTDVLAPNTRTPFVLPLGKAFKVRLGGFVQANGEFIDPGSFEGNFADNPVGGATHVPINDRFRLRRARINISGELYERFDFKMEGDFAQGDGLSGRTGFSGTDIFANWNQFPEAQVKVGQYKSPYGLEHLTSDSALFTAERSLVTTALTQDRQVGVSIWGKPLANVAPKGMADLVDYNVGIFNGNGRNTIVNDEQTFMYVGRLGLTPFKGKLWDEPAFWRFAANGYRSRFGTGTRASPAGNLRLNLLDGSLAPLVPTGLSRGEGWGVDQWLNVGPFDLIAEYLQSYLRPEGNTSFDSFKADGYYVQASSFLPMMGGKKFQLVAKWESFNPDQASNDDIRSITGGLNYYINGDALKVMLNYVHTWSDFRDENAGTGNSEFDLALVRFQLMF